MQVPKARSRSGAPEPFRSSLVPPYVRCSASVDAAVPWLYLHGVSTGQMRSGVAALVGEEVARGLSANVVSRLKRVWDEEYRDWCRRSLNDDWVYVWADDIHSGLCGDDGRLCVLVVIGVNARGDKHFLAIPNRADVEDIELHHLDTCFKAPLLSNGLQVHMPYTAYAHWMLMHRLLTGAGVERLQVNMDIDSMTRGGLPLSVRGRGQAPRCTRLFRALHEVPDDRRTEGDPCGSRPSTHGTMGRYPTEDVVVVGAGARPMAIPHATVRRAVRVAQGAGGGAFVTSTASRGLGERGSRSKGTLR